MGKQRIRWALATAVVVVFAPGLSPIPAVAGASPAPPAPSLGRAHADLGILALRRQLLQGVTSAPNMTPKTQAPLTSTCALPVWRVVDGQNGGWNNFLGGVAAISPTDMWAVGNSQANQATSTGNGDQNLAEHWDGSAWTVVSTPQPGADSNDLNDVAATATNDAWAVGLTNTNGIDESSVFHWNGTTWGANAAPLLAGTSVLSDVTAVTATNYWAVGQQWDLGLLHWVTLVEHYDGSSWTETTVPNLGAGDNILFGVGSDSAGDVWAVGYYKAADSPTSPHLPLIERMPAGGAFAATSVAGDTLISVAGTSAMDAVAVGYSIGSNGLPQAIAFHSDGTSWTTVGVNEPSVFGEVLGDVVYSAAAGGYVGAGFDWSFGNGSVPGNRDPFVVQGSGLTTFQPSGALTTSNATGNNEFFSVAAPAANDIWGVGTILPASTPAKTLIENYAAPNAPSGLSAVAADQSAQLSWTPSPCSTPAVTSYTVTAYDGCTVQGSTQISSIATTASIPGLTNGTTYTFKIAAVNALGTGPQSSASNAVTPFGTTKPASVTACSPLQYSLPGSDGSTWMTMDATNLSVTFTPQSDGVAVLSGNVDLWTANAGYNQDVGIAVSGGTGPIYPTVAGQPEAWKESGGFAGTFSPNAAFVQSYIPVKAAQTYTARLQWKANRPDGGSIFAGAGPIAGAFSPTRLTVQLSSTASARAFSGVSTTQRVLTGSNGMTWTDMDTTNLSVPFTVPAAGTWIAVVTGNSDLWTANGGYNQDIGVSLTGTGYPTNPGQPEAWKESGGFAGTFSPNAAFVQVSLPVTNSLSYTAKLQWKTNKSDPGSIFAGAGPIAGKFSPTRLTVLLYPLPRLFAGSTLQYHQANSDGIYWMPVDVASQISLAPGAAVTYMISGNSDLWTANPGYNQDIGIMVTGGAYGGGTLVAWKESGGFAGTFSPNAAFVSAALQLQVGPTYTFQLVWKANHIPPLNTPVPTIFAGAGPINANFSGTSLIAVPLG